MPLNMSLALQTAGEQIMIGVTQHNPVTGEIMHDVDQMAELMEKGIALADVRAHEINTRMLEAYGFRRYFDPSTWTKISSILDIIGGKMSAARVKELFDATREETADLEAGRLAAMQALAANGTNQCTCDTNICYQHNLGIHV